MSLFADNFIQLRKMPSDIPDLALWLLPPPMGLYAGNPWALPQGAEDYWLRMRLDASQGLSLGPDDALPSLEDYSRDATATRVLTDEVVEGYPVYEVASGTQHRSQSPLSSPTMLSANTWYLIQCLVKPGTVNYMDLYVGGDTTWQEEIPDGWNWVSRVYRTSGNPHLELLTSPNQTIKIAAIKAYEILGNHAYQDVSDSYPSYLINPARVSYDGVDDNWTVNFPSPVAGTMLVATPSGVIHLEVEIPAGEWELFTDASVPAFGGSDIEILIYDRILSPSELAEVMTYLESNASMIVNDFSDKTSLADWLGDLTYVKKVYFSHYDLSNVTEVTRACLRSGLQSIVLTGVNTSTVEIFNEFCSATDINTFPASDVNVSSGRFFENMLSANGNLASLDISSWSPAEDAISFYRFLRNASSLATLTTSPALFDTGCVNYDAFVENCALDQTSIMGIINNLLPAVISRNLRDGTLGLSGGSNASPTYLGEANMDVMGIMGWDVTANGHTTKTSPYILDFTDKLTALRPEWVTAGWTYTRNGPKWVLQDGAFVELAANQFGTTWDDEEQVYAYYPDAASENVLLWSEGDVTTLTTATNVADAASTFLNMDGAIYFGGNAVQREALKTYSGFTSGEVYTISMFVDLHNDGVPTVDPGDLNGDLSLVIQGVEAIDNITVTKVYGTTYRVAAQTTASSTGSGSVGVIKKTGHSSVGFIVSGMMLEEGVSWATGYIKTEGSTVTRAADVLSLDLSSLTDLSTDDVSVYADAKKSYRDEDAHSIVDIRGTLVADDFIFLSITNYTGNKELVLHSRGGGISNATREEGFHRLTRMKMGITLNATVNEAVAFLEDAFTAIDDTPNFPVDLVQIGIGCTPHDHDNQFQGNIYKAGLILKGLTTQEFTTIVPSL